MPHWRLTCEISAIISAMSILPLPTPAPAPKTLLVACLCANWCTTCRDYQPRFQQLADQFPNLQFVWIDIEDEADLVDPIEVENFPTILIATAQHALFFGTMLPHIQALQRLIVAQLADTGRTSPSAPDVDDLAERLWQHSGR